MIILVECSTCQGNGWTEEFEQVGEYDWEPRQEVCGLCCGRGKIEVEVDEKTGMPK